LFTEIKNGKGPNNVYQFQEQTVLPGQSLTVHSDYNFLRYMSDHESWTTLYPSNTMSLRVYFPSECEVEYFDVESVGDLNEVVTDGGQYHDVDISEILLPHQGLNFYWKFKENSGS
jgi:hypothetical protein